MLVQPGLIRTQTIPIIYGTDHNYVKATYVSLFSLLINAPQRSIFDVVILVPGQFSTEDRMFLLRLNNRFPNLNLRFLDMGSMFSHIHPQIAHIKYPSFYRLMIAQILPEYEKCIYLDSDTIVNNDITELFEMDVEPYCVIGVRDALCLLGSCTRKAKELGIESTDRYMNAGVMLLNTKKMRVLDVTKDLLKAVDRNFYYVDQDVINSVLYKYIKNVSPKFNALPMVTYSNNRSVISCYSELERREARENPTVVHYIDPNKPWIDPKALEAHRWWKYAELSGYRS
jgi:lipopolysaccharide biosynthesis glycosyltransferase